MRGGAEHEHKRQPKGWWQQYLEWSGKAKKKSRDTKPRVRLTLLILLWVWAALVFVVVDLFYNVPEFGGIRPRSETYRAMRYTAHEIVGLQYEDDDESGAASRAAPGSFASDSEALAVVQERIRIIAVEARVDPHLAVPTDTLERVDMRQVEPPPQFKGTQLEWRLHGAVSTEEMARLLRSLKDLDPRDRRAVLHRVFREPDVRLAAPLVDAKKGVDGPPLLLLYAAAGRSIVRQHKQAPEPATEKSVADVIQATLETLVRLVTRFRPYLDESQWGGVQAALVQLFRDAPGFAENPRYRPLVDAIRDAARQTLMEAAKAEPNYMGGLEPVKLGLLLADEGLRDVLLDLLRARGVFNEKIASAESRRDVAFLSMTASAIIQAGSPRQRAELAIVIGDGLSLAAQPPPDGETRDTLLRLGRSLLKKLPASFDERVTAALRAAVQSVEGEGK